MPLEGSIEHFGTFVSRFTLDDAPIQVVQQGKKLVLDAVIGVLAASQYPGGRIPAQTAKELDVLGNGLNNSATILSTGEFASPSNAAFANAQCSIAMDVASNLYFSQGLSGVSVFPALALAERDHLSGTKLLEALIPAYEVVGRVALSFPAHYRPPSVVLQESREGTPSPRGFGYRWIGFGSAVGAAKVMQLDASSTAHALALAASAVPIPCPPGNVHKNMAKYGLFGMMAWGGIVSSQLALNGFTGDIGLLDDGRFHQAVGSYLDDHLAFSRDLGVTWLIMDANFKRYPAGTHNNQGLHTVEQIMRDEKLVSADITSVSAGRAIGTSGAFADPHPNNYVETQASFPYQCAAVMTALPHKEWGDAFDNRELLELADRVSLATSPKAITEFEEEWTKGPVRSPWWFRTFVTVETRGATIERWSDYGIPSDEELANNFRHWAEGVIKPDSIESVIEMVFKLDQLDDVSKLTRAIADLY